jgi:predicted 3-demethylubiquinone-9 3-methyltransferase (glyoxalase superfamily)
MISPPRITTCLWFDRQAEQAVACYTRLLPNSRVLEVQHAMEGLPYHRAGEVLTIRFSLDGTEYLALNGGKHHQLTPAVSVVVHCDDQAEVDRLWDALCEGGQESRCGWLVDRWGLSWQIVPRALLAMINDRQGAAAQRAMAAVLTMGRIDLATVERAWRAAA